MCHPGTGKGGKMKKENRKCSCNTLKIGRGSKGAGRAPETTQFFETGYQVDSIPLNFSFPGS